MKRKAVLYIVNFLLPVLCFLCLDMASFLISDSGGEKLSFKVTVLLAVTVLQLILNDILPATSNRVPIIGNTHRIRADPRSNTVSAKPLEPRGCIEAHWTCWPFIQVLQLKNDLTSENGFDQ